MTILYLTKALGLSSNVFLNGTDILSDVFVSGVAKQRQKISARVSYKLHRGLLQYLKY